MWISESMKALGVLLILYSFKCSSIHLCGIEWHLSMHRLVSLVRQSIETALSAGAAVWLLWCHYQPLSGPCSYIQPLAYLSWAQELTGASMSSRGKLFASSWMELFPSFSRLSDLGLTTLGGSHLLAAGSSELPGVHGVQGLWSSPSPPTTEHWP